jgi:lipid-A-disaccharide synthase
MMNAKRLFIITGDYSGDVHAANVVKALRQRQPDIEIAAVGGRNLQAQGVPLVSDQSQMGRMGLGVVLGGPYHYFLGKKVLKFLKDFHPDAVLLIDYGVFNLWMAKQLKRMGIKVLYFIPPQVWASRKGRLQKIKASVDHVFCIFPFEEPLYQAHGIPVTYVGHPLIGQLPPSADKVAFCQAHGLDPEKPIVGVFPGSRKMEIDYLLDAIVGSMAKIREAKSDVQFVLAKAASLKPDYFNQKLQKALAIFPALQTMPLTVLENENHAVLSVSDALIAKSGTTTLEAALYRTPMVIMYKGHPFMYWIALQLCYLPCIGLPNILTDMQNPIVKELWQDAVNPTEIAAHVLPLLNPQSAEYQRQQQGFEKIHQLFSVGDAPSNVADRILDILHVEMGAKSDNTAKMSRSLLSETGVS